MSTFIAELRLGEEELRVQEAEVSEVSTRICGLIQEAFGAVSKSPDAWNEDAGFDIEDEGASLASVDFSTGRYRVEVLLASLNLEARQQALRKARDWFKDRVPGAQRDLHILDKLDRDCFKRESELSFTAMALEERLRKRERLPAKGLQQFCRELSKADASEKSKDARRETTQREGKLVAMSDEELHEATKDLKVQLALKEEEARVSLQSIKDKNKGIKAATKFFKEANSLGLDVAEVPLLEDILVAQERQLLYEKETLRHVEGQRELIRECADYISGKPRPMGQYGEPKPPSASLVVLLENKRKEVRSQRRGELVSKRKVELGDAIVMPNEAYLLRLKDECEDIEHRTRAAVALKEKCSDVDAVKADIEQQFSDILGGMIPVPSQLESCLEMLDPTRDWAAENFRDEDPGSPLAAESEWIGRKETDLSQQVRGLQEAQSALHGELLQVTQMLQATQGRLSQEEINRDTAKETFELLKDQHALILTTLSCTRMPGGSSPMPKRQGGRGRDDPALSAALDEAASEVLGSLALEDSPWLQAFQEGETGAFSKDEIHLQNEVLMQLSKEEKHLQKECEELHQVFNNHAEEVIGLAHLDGRDKSLSLRCEALKNGTSAVASAVEDLTTSLKSLMAVGQSLPAQASDAKSTSGASLSRGSRLFRADSQLDSAENMLKARKGAIENAKATLKVLGAVTGTADAGMVGTFQLAMFELRQVVLVEAKNRKLMAKISELGPVTEKLRMKFRDVKEGRAQGRPYGQPESELQQEERKQSRLVRQQTRALTATREGFHLSLARDERSFSRQTSPAPVPRPRPRSNSLVPRDFN
mmetsp:Transcript_10752/g.19510  ORF Transcript_10752/g.19510 Transcript_10752/m.19510 type:complete len:822 (+) Transcript_10752:152-2617(+)